MLCWDRLCWDRLCWDRLCWDRLCWDRLCWDGLCWDRLCWDRLCWAGIGCAGIGWALCCNVLYPRSAPPPHTHTHVQVRAALLKPLELAFTEGRSADLALRTAMGEALPDAYKVCVWGGGGAQR